MELQNAPHSCNVPPLKQLNRCFTHHLLCKLLSSKLCNSLYTINWELHIYLELNKLNSANCWKSVEESCKMEWTCKCKLWCMKYMHNNDKQDLGFYSIFILDFTTWHRKCLENNIKITISHFVNRAVSVPLPRSSRVWSAPPFTTNRCLLFM